MMTDFKEVKKQSEFCLKLMEMLNSEIQGSGDGYYSGMQYHTRKQDDIKRIRREMMKLANMLDPWKGD